MSEQPAESADASNQLQPADASNQLQPAATR